MITWWRRRRDAEDSGFALIFVLMICAVVTAVVGTSLVVVAPNVLAGNTSANSAAAELAAESGINDVVAYLSNIPACRSQTRVCSQAFGLSTYPNPPYSSTPNVTGRPALAPGQKVYWSTAGSLTTDGYLRVQATGVVGSVSRTLVADLSLQPSILSYGYYTDYESQAPSFINSYDTARNIYITNSNTLNSTAYSGWYRSLTPPQTAYWSGAAADGSDAICGQHWYQDSATLPGRASVAGGSSNPTPWTEEGTFAGYNTTHTGTCDLVFTTGMIENGPTYTRDALFISNGGGSGPQFQQPVYTLWGYQNDNNPAAPAQPWRQLTGQESLASSPYQPVVAPYDLTLPPTIGTNGLSTNSCVYYGPTRVVLNGDGTATVTSPETTTRNAQSDAGCYPAGSLAGGIVGWTFNYTTTGSGTIYAKNLNKPNSGWPQSALTTTTTPSASNEVFYLPVTGTTNADPSTSAAPTSGCSTTSKYSSTASATCAWTNVATTTDNGSGSLGWTSYSSTNKCNTTLQPTDRQLFECEYGQTANQAKTPPSNGFSAVQSTIQGGLNSGSCLPGGATAEQTCMTNWVNSVLAVANTGGHPYNYATPANGDHRYSATTSSPTVTTGPIKTVGSAPANPTSGDSLFTYSGTPATEQPTLSTMTTSVVRQTYNSTKKSWTYTTPVAQFAFTTTRSDWAITQQASGASYFPNPQDVTRYPIGATSSGAAAGSSGTSQPGDLYVQGVNNGELSLIADDDVELTGNITKTSGDTSTANPVSITAGVDVRNYHPVSCVDQTATDINNTSAGWCPNDITGLYSGGLVNSNGTFNSAHPAAQYANINPTGDRVIDAVVFTLSGSLRTDNYDRAPYVGNLIINGGIYQSHRGANGTTTQYSSSSTPARTGTTLTYNYVDLERADLPYAPSATNSSGNPRPWNVVSISAGVNPTSSGSTPPVNGN